MLRLNNPDQNTFHDLTIGRQEVLLLKGKFAIQTFRHVLEKYRSRLIPEKNSPLDCIFLAYGRCVQTLSELPQSYSEANQILSRRFFCMEGQHTVGYESLPKLIGVKPIL
jgi:two-component system response regulator YesN